MKRALIIVALALFLVSTPVFAQFRADLGIDAPFAQGLWADGNFTWGLIGNGDAIPFIPVPDVGLYFQVPLGFVRLGGGVRALPLFFINFAWPNVFAEINLGRIYIEAQLGGGAVAFYVPGATPWVFTGPLFFPDLSVWVAPFSGKRLRFGVGAFGITTQPGEGGLADLPVGMLFYAGAKFVL